MKKNAEERKLHIAMIGHKHVPSREGGVEIVVWELAKRLHEAGYEVDCYNRKEMNYHDNNRQRVIGKKGYYYDGIRMISIPTFENAKLNAIVYSVLGTIRILFGHYDIIHFHAEGPCIMMWLPKLFGKKTVATIHGLDWQRSKWGNFASSMLKRGEATAAKRADEIIVLSRNVEDYFKETYGRKTLYIPNGITKPMHFPPDLIKKEYGLNGNDYIFTLSRIVPEKGIHYLIEAFEKSGTNKKLVIIGGSGNDEIYWNQISDMSSKNDNIIMTGFQHDQMLGELCSNAYLFVLPSDVEGMSVSLLEAMSYGNCCLVSDIPENTEVTGDKAITFRKSDVGDLTDKLRSLFNEPNKVAEMKKESAAYICARYSWDKMTEETEKIYDRVMDD